LDSASNSAASDKGHTGALYSKNSDPAAEAGVVLFTTALGLYGGVLWSGEFQGFLIHELAPIYLKFLRRQKNLPPTAVNQKHPGFVGRFSPSPFERRFAFFLSRSVGLKTGNLIT
jgi:hypothetical protein